MSQVQILANQFTLNTRLFNNVLNGIKDEQGSEQIDGHINHLQWIAGHLITSRYRNVASMGINLQFPYNDVYTDITKPPPANRPINKETEYPPLSELVKYWNEVSPVFVESFGKIPQEHLSKPIQLNLPGDDNTLFGLFSFLTTHESYHIGQMSIIRRHLGFGPMSFI